MFKFYSKVVGVPYLFNTLARFIVELNTIAGSKSKASQSLLSVDMELDASKLADEGNDTADTEANLYQLILACQKVFSSLQKAIPTIPFEFIEIFANIRDGIIGKFPDSSDAVYKAVGGFLFLRFICPALTAPHFYGLLPSPPNQIAQRQLILIGKVVQNLANLVRPTAKEAFMLRLSDFFDKNIPKMLKFYLDVLARWDAPPPSITDQAVNPARDPPKVVAENALGSIWNHMYLFKSKVLAECNGDYSALKGTVEELYEEYKEPKKITQKKDKNRAATEQT
jgi:neurofibromin 1